MTYHVYVLRSTTHLRYTGVTTDLAQRLRQHNDHTLSRWTKRGRDWCVTYLESYPTAHAAHRRERWLKSGVGREYLSTHEAWRLE